MDFKDQKGTGETLGVTPLNPLSDYVYKQLFGVKGREEELGDFLHHSLDFPAIAVEGLTYEDTQISKRRKQGRSGAMDVHAKLLDGTEINIEPQIKTPERLAERAGFYAASLTHDQAFAGNNYRRPGPGIVMFLLEGRWRQTNVLHYTYEHWDRRNKDALADGEFIHLIQLQNLQYYQEQTGKLNWFRFIAAKTWEEIEMAAKTNPYIAKSAERLWHMSADKNERRAYDRWLREQLNYNTEMLGAEDRGREEARQEHNRKTVLSSVKLGLSIEQIQAIIELPESEIRKIIKEAATE